MNFFVWILFAVSIASTLADTNSSSLCNTKTQGAAEASAKASNALAFKLYQKIIQDNPSKNIIFSPVSIALALALLESGAAGSTQRELQTVLAPPGSNDLDSSKLYQTLQNELQGSSVDDYKIRIANGLFYDKDLKLKSAYVEQTKQCFQTELAKTPFKTDVEGARKQINDWVSNATQQKIPELFKDGSLTPATAAVIANAIYFKASWDDKFPRTEDLDFYKGGNSNDAQKVKFMVANDEYKYASIDNAEIVEIPYKGSLFVMQIILPKSRNGIQQLEQSLTADKLSSVQLDRRQVNLKLPKFTTRLSLDLKKVLNEIGQQQMFSDQADFSRLSDDPLKVSGAVHEAYIKINENGTEAAAATGFKLTFKSAVVRPPSDPISFIADHPFSFAIMHKPSNAIAFMGKITSVEEAKEK